jgi:hypothetical protein
MKTLTRGNTIHYPEFLVWSAAFVGIPAWAVHLVFEAAMVHFADEHHGWEWTLHAATILTALVTVAGIALCYDLYRRAEQSRRSEPPMADEDGSSDVALSRFLGLLGVILGVANLVLILVEGFYVLVVRHGG